MISHLIREFSFMLRQRNVAILLVLSLVLSSFAIITGISEIAKQRATIDSLISADNKDRSEAQAKYDDPGSLAYYSFHLTYDSPSNIAFAALGDRDIYPWKHRIRMLALEGQIYESDAQNAELAQAGKIDFAFVISLLSPLLVILLFHDLRASERSNGRYELLSVTASSNSSLWFSRFIVRFVSLCVCLLLPFFIGAIVSQAAVTEVLLFTVLTFLYLLFWAVLSVFIGRKSEFAPRIAAILIGIWTCFAFILPALGNLYINHTIVAPQGGEILLTQREKVNDAWDLPAETTMTEFVQSHPTLAQYTAFEGGFHWKWYYAFQQLGDEAASELSQQYRDAKQQKYQSAGYLALLSPPAMLQRFMTRAADTDVLAALEYEEQIRSFHRDLRMYYYPYLFDLETFEKDKLDDLPVYAESNANQLKQ